MSTIVEHAQRSKHETHKQHRKSRRSNSPRHQKFSLKELITGNNRSLEAMQNELDDYRCIYQHEVKSLTDELVSFREQCQNEIVNQAQTVEKKSRNARKEVDCNNNNTKVNRNDAREQNRLAEKEAELLKRTQDLLNREDELIEREDELTSRQEGLASYKQEIDSLEEYLDRRMTAIKRREEEIIELDQDIKQLSSDLKSDKEKLLKDSGLDEEKSKKGIAQLNWDFVRKSMIDKHSALEKTYKKTVQEMNAKEQVVEELKSKVDELSELIEQKDTKIIELEARLSLTVTNDLRQSNITRTRSLTSPPTNHNASNGNSRRTASLRRHYSDSATKYTDNDLNSSTTCAVM